MKLKLPEEGGRRIERKREPISDRLFKWLSRTFGSILKTGKTKPSEEFVESLNYLGWDLKPEQVISASWLLMILAFALFALLTVFAISAGQNFTFYILCLAAFPLIIQYLVTNYHQTRARLSRLEALCHMPTTITKLVIFLKQVPNLENALKFAVEYEKGKIASTLKRALWDCWTGSKSDLEQVLPSIAEEWGKYSEGLKRALYRIMAALHESSSASRKYSLDAALKTILDSTTEKMSDYAASLSTPTMMLFTFGTVFPLAIISMLPVVGMLGLAFGTPLRIFALLMLIILSIYVYSNKIIQERPPTVAPPDIPDDLPGFPPEGRLRINVGSRFIEASTLTAPAVVFIAIAFPGIIYFISQIPGVTLMPGLAAIVIGELNTLSIVWALALSLFLYFYGTSAYKTKIAEEIAVLEREFLASLQHLSSRLSEGRAPEEALQFASDLMPKTKIAKFYSRISSLMRERRMTLKEALFDAKVGALRDVHSGFVKSTMKIFADTAEKSIRTAGEVLYTVSQHYTALRETDAKIRQELSQKISTMKMTSLVFAPAICGIVVTMQKLITKTVLGAQAEFGDIGILGISSPTMIQAPTVAPETLLMIVGIYLILLDLVLIRFGTIIAEGHDPVKLRTTVAKTLPIAALVFTLTYFLSKSLLTGMF